ncbi:MAG: N-acetylmuramoyl-L-alanine amidase [Proteiniphilum sp.]|nr:N-acetylmuramoyl-L-alanine amidase [Proteiniphilum sp.]MDD2725803.1 N-acetylmuramoyl-L-alanine amidase [Proteiniphilum sp.]MDD3331803.1 N-acetylmuramoyl-L-alanine amidase [Proteiniphilum sp.]MDD3555036.1 N-acetylmuramoyl-L-alanine amidase [Proteiniphilum sp.]MDD4485242.1 N-acetylmuramoyl-L-alanine amidase [Proteiniphilum sp.]
MMPRNHFFVLVLLGALFTLFPGTRSFAQSRPFTVVIDPGHGGKDPGAVGATSREKDIVLSVGLRLGALIEQHHKDVDVIYTRDNDHFVDLKKRAEIANKAHADLFISLHCNALDRRRTSPQGVETFVLGLHRSKDNLDVAKAENAVIMYEEDYSVKYEGFNPNEPESYIIFEFMSNAFLSQSVYLATIVQNQLVTGAKRVNRNVRQAGFLVLREVGMPSILVELGYISNRQEEKFLKSSSGQTTLANAIYNGFREYKREHDKKSYVFNSNPTSPVTGDAVSSADRPGDKEYRVQFLTSSRKYGKGSKVFKGLDPVDHYVENGLYKYTYGSTGSQSQINRTLREVRRSFKDAFVIEMVDGQRLK